MIRKPMMWVNSVTIALAAAGALAGEPATPTPPANPNTPATQPVPPQAPKPLQIQAVPVTQPSVTTDWTQTMNDYQGEDAAKKAAAEKAFLEAGARGVPVLDMLAKKTPELAKRVGELKGQIDKRSMELYQEAAALATQQRSEALTPQALETQRQKWMQVATYAPQQPLRQSAFQQVQALQKQVQSVGQALQQLNAYDQQLNGQPKPAGLAKAAIQLERAEALKKLQRLDEALAATKDAVDSSGPKGRLTPGALKLHAEMLLAKEDAKGAEEICKKILAEYPRSLEVKYARGTLVELCQDGERWDEALSQVKAFMAAYPLDEEPQSAATGLLNTLMDDAREYIRAVQLADWMIETLPIDRLAPEAPKNAAGIYEYVVRDYERAERACTMLRDEFPDLVDRADMDRMLARLKQKRDGQFPKEPQLTGDGPEFAFAAFLKAVRTRDKTALAALVPKDEVEDYSELLTDTLDNFVPQITFTDFELKKVDVDAKGETATLLLKLHEPDSAENREVKQKALKQDGFWKIQWTDPDEAAEENPATQQPKKFVVPDAPPVPQK